MDDNRRSPRFSGPRALVAAALLALVGLVALGGGSGRAAQAEPAATPVATPTPATLYVEGQGSVTVPPDTASVTVGVDVQRDRLRDAQAEASAQAAAIIAAAEAGGVATDDIQTANFGVNVVRDYDRDGNPGPVVGYQVSNQVELTVREPDRLGAILDAVVAAGANNIYGIAFYVEDPSAAASQARAQAVRDARTKAEELATAAGVRLGRVLSITESSAPPPAPEVFARGAAEMDAAQAAVPIQAGTSEIVVDVQMTFELEQG
jgi:uncharacterized protein YggE